MRARASRDECDPNPLVFRALFDPRGLDGCRIEFDAIRFSVDVAYCPYNVRDVIQFVACPPGKIDVHRGAGDRCLPRRQKERAFQYEPINNRRIGEAIEKSLHRKILE